ncbi:hypothetical protein HDR61_02135 [bacterium]|nr:hypothetical protein [bacterium]
MNKKNIMAAIMLGNMLACIHDSLSVANIVDLHRLLAEHGRADKIMQKKKISNFTKQR